MKTLNKLLSLIVVLSMVMPVALVPSIASAVTPTTIFSDGFGTGNTDTTFNETPAWVEGGDGAEKRKETTSGNDTSSPEGGRFALIDGDGGWICRVVDVTGYQSINLSIFLFIGEGIMMQKIMIKQKSNIKLVEIVRIPMVGQICIM